METLLKSITRQPWGTTLEDIIEKAGEGDAVTVVFRAVEKKREEKPLHISGESIMYHWNKNIPMPLRVMRGRVLSETRGMVYMELRACPLKTDYCMKCGKPLTHPVSRLYGLGPECGGHYHINPFNTEEELQNAIQEVRQKLNNITWTGWIAKSGVEYATEVLSNGNVATRSRS